MNTNRLEYDSLKSVLRYLDPNLRIQLRARTPSIRTIDKMFPIKIRQLSFDQQQISINNTTYTLGIYRQYHDPEEIPRQHQKENEAGGVRTDPDQWAFGLYDAPVRDVYEILEREEIDDEHEDETRKQVIIKSEALRLKLAISGGDERKSDVIIPQLIDRPDSIRRIAGYREKVKTTLKITVKELEDSIDYDCATLLSYYYRKHNLVPPYTPFIQLTMESPNRKIIERVASLKQLPEAVKYISSVIFGHNRYPFLVTETSFNNFDLAQKIPSELKIRAREITLGFIPGSGWRNLIHESSFPLDTVTMGVVGPDARKLTQDFVKSAEKLVISNGFMRIGSWIRVIQTLKNQIIILKHESDNETVEDYVNLIHNWIETEKPVGSTLLLGFRQRRTILNLVVRIRIQLGAPQKEDRKIVLPMENGSELVVSYEEVQKNDVKFKAINERNQSNWALKISVV